MNIKEDKKIRKILLDVQTGEDINKAMLQLKVVLGGLRLDTDKIDLQCFNCGEVIRPFDSDNQMAIVFDEGSSDSMAGPGDPAMAYSVCEKCLGDP